VPARLHLAIAFREECRGYSAPDNDCETKQPDQRRRAPIRARPSTPCKLLRCGTFCSRNSLPPCTSLLTASWNRQQKNQKRRSDDHRHGHSEALPERRQLS
jgi:hypothetical protein